MPIACTRDGRSLAARPSDLRAGVLAEAVAAERLPDGTRWQFRPREDLFARLGAVIDVNGGAAVSFVFTCGGIAAGES